MLIGEIVLVSVAVVGCIAVAVLFWKCLDIPPECCAPSESERCDIQIEIEGIQ